MTGGRAHVQEWFSLRSNDAVLCAQPASAALCSGTDGSTAFATLLVTTVDSTTTFPVAASTVTALICRFGDRVTWSSGEHAGRLCELAQRPCDACCSDTTIRPARNLGVRDVTLRR